VAPLTVARVADGEVPDGGDEHPASTTTASAAASRTTRSGTAMHLHRWGEIPSANR
jgi:hypothetical protein